MSFYPRRKRNAPTIIIISLIDVLIVMLVFLLVTSTFRNQPAVKLTLPDIGDGLKAGASEAKPPLVVTIARKSAKDPTYFLGDRPVSTEKLLTELQAAGARDAATKLVLRADREAEWEDVARAMQFAKKANIASVRAFTKQAQ